MFISYFIILLLAIVFRLYHWPGSSLLFLISPLLLSTDLLILLIRKKENKEVLLWSTGSVLFLSVYFLFKFLNWPGNEFHLYGGLLLALVCFYRVFQRKIKLNLRLKLTGVLVVFALVNASMSGSTFRLFYMLEDPFNDYVPHFIVQRLAFDFYNEGQYEKAEKLIRRNCNHLEDLLQHSNYERTESYIEKTDLENLSMSKKDLVEIRKRVWKEKNELFPMDRSLEDE